MELGRRQKWPWILGKLAAQQGWYGESPIDGAVNLELDATIAPLPPPGPIPSGRLRWRIQPQESLENAKADYTES